MLLQRKNYKHSGTRNLPKVISRKVLRGPMNCLLPWGCLCNGQRSEVRGCDRDSQQLRRELLLSVPTAEVSGES